MVVDDVVSILTSPSTQRHLELQGFFKLLYSSLFEAQCHAWAVFIIHFHVCSAFLGHFLGNNGLCGKASLDSSAACRVQEIRQVGIIVR